MKKIPIVAIVGRANVGKSSIYNCILRRRETIVAREEGTTRDAITSIAHHKNQSFWLVDTAGLKSPEDDFEATIQEQITQAVESADVIWVVIDATTVITQEDHNIAKLALRSKKPVFLVVNKIDKVSNSTETDYLKLGIKQVNLTSATQNGGFTKLLDDLVKQIPKASYKADDDIIRIAIVGRPNVGKSHLFNTLLNKQQALVSNIAGTTRDVNKKIIRYEGRSFEIMDTAGIRRSGKIEKGIEHFSVLRTVAAIDEADICLLVMDANELNVQLDQKIAGMVKDAVKGLVLIISKWDSLENKTPYTSDQIMAEIKHNYSFVPWASLIFTSAITGQNVAKLLPVALDIYQERGRVIKTSELNRWLRETVAKHPPTGLKRALPKLHYIVQEADNPSPTFKIYGSETRLLHWSYKRFLERELREKFGFEGTAIKFWFFEKGYN